MSQPSCGDRHKKPELRASSSCIQGVFRWHCGRFAAIEANLRSGRLPALLQMPLHGVDLRLESL